MTTTTKAKTESPLRLIATDIIAENPNNPRADLGDLTELTASIQAHGVIQPILVRRVEDGYECVAGSRRLAVAKAIGMGTIPCNVREMDDLVAHELAVTENIVRKDMTLVDEIRAVALLADNGDSLAEIAARFGRTVKWVLTRRKISRMPPIVLERIASDELSLSDAEILCRIDNPEIVAELAEKSYDIATDVARRLRDISKAPWVTPKSECATCLMRSDKQCSLFDEEGPAKCMDAGCWDKKREMWIAKKTAELRKEGHLPMREFMANYQFDNCYGSILDENAEDQADQVAEMKEAGIKPRYRINPDTFETILRYDWDDMPEKTEKTASGDDAPEAAIEDATEADYAEINGNDAEDCRQPSNDASGTYNTEEDEEPEEPAPEPAWKRKFRIRKEIADAILQSGRTDFSDGLLLQFCAEALRCDMGRTHMDEEKDRTGTKVLDMPISTLKRVLVADLAECFYAEPGDENYADWQQFAEAFGVVEEAK